MDNLRPGHGWSLRALRVRGQSVSLRRTPRKDEASTPTEDDANECLHCAIVDMVDERMPPAVPTLRTLQP